MSEEHNEHPDAANGHPDSSLDSQPGTTTSAAGAHDSTGVAEQIEEMRAADGAAVLERLDSDDAAEVAEILDPDTAGDILAEMEPQAAADVISDMEAPEASMVLAAMDPDDRVDILEHVTPELHDELMREMDSADAAEVQRLEQYPPDTAGGIMTTQVTALPLNLSVEQAIQELRRINEEIEQMFYVYVVDKQRRLVGVLSMRDLILALPTRQIAQISRPSVLSIPASMDQEEVARLFRKYNYLAMPVVDGGNRLVGLITVDDVVDVMEEEATEDVQKMFGAGAEERLASPWTFSFKKRIWWLEVNLGTAFLAAFVISLFDKTIAALPILAAYQSIVSGMGGNGGAQAMAVAIRGIALGEDRRTKLAKIVYRELLVGILTGVVIGLTTWLCAACGVFGYHQKPFALGFVICMALIFNQINACVSGVSIPFLMKSLGFDPAQSATIFATTFTDCGGFFATLWLAQVCMHWLK
jgi:magnesium transporter